MSSGGKKSSVRIVLVTAGFLLILSAIGYMSISQSNYQDLASLTSIDRKTKVTIEADIAPIGRGNMILEVDGKRFNVTGYGSYAVATDAYGNVYAVFLLTDGEQVVLALYEAGETYMANQMGSGLMSSVVVSAVYDPDATALLLTPQGQLSLPVLYVDAILKGCHTSYSEGAATTS